jgi:hypothetical protein
MTLARRAPRAQQQLAHHSTWDVFGTNDVCGISTHANFHSNRARKAIGGVTTIQETLIRANDELDRHVIKNTNTCADSARTVSDHTLM